MIFRLPTLIETLRRNARNFAVPFVLGCAVSVLSLVEKTSALYQYRLTIAIFLIGLGIVVYFYETLATTINEYAQRKAELELIIGDARQILVMENITRKYVLNDRNTLFELSMDVRNISSNSINTMDLRFRADNGNGSNPELPDIVITKCSVNGTSIGVPESRILDSRMVSWTSSIKKQCEITLRLPLSLRGSLEPRKRSSILIQGVLKNNLAVLDINKETADDSITFEITVPTRRFKTVIETASSSGDNWSCMNLVGDDQCPLGVGAYGGYGGMMDQTETSRLPLPIKGKKGYIWEVERPLLGYTYCIRFRLGRKGQ